jgi:hypothetical protein
MGHEVALKEFTDYHFTEKSGPIGTAMELSTCHIPGDLHFHIKRIAGFRLSKYIFIIRNSVIRPKRIK